ncbi:unnamed protein product [Albugo candida]|uniref:Ion transport domain-containing protein n=1 Tax=Albugo candida TaxID=65357 RepID=A0A024G2X5_9STRA|nr:unnamed protein product [Albugo candida]|eukprot:CCI41125.1 unnamed protein product [Albugo candida]
MHSSHRVAPEVNVKDKPASVSKSPPKQNLLKKVLGSIYSKKTKATLTPQQQYEQMSPWKRQIFLLLDAKWFTIMMLIVTVYALFGDDIRLSLFHKSADNSFYTLATTSLVLFTIEFLLSCYARPNYLFSFYFLLDLIATFSVLPDIGWVWDEIVSPKASMKASKATKTGSKAGRIVRVVRAVRLFRVVKLLKWKHQDQNADQLQESKVGSRMGEVTIQRVVILVLFLIMVLPVFDGGYSDTTLQYQDYGLRPIHMLLSSGYLLTSSTEYRRLLEGYVRDGGKLVYFQLTNHSMSDLYDDIASIRFQVGGNASSSYTQETNPSNKWSFADMYRNYEDVITSLRSIEMNIVKYNGCYNTLFVAVDKADLTSACSSLAVFDVSSATSTGAAFSILKTVFIMIVLVAGSNAFIGISRSLVLQPIERMMDIVRKLVENPMVSVTTSGNDAKIHKDAKELGFETALLELTLFKVGRLMQVGFGAAGADIIGKNMGSGDLDPMLPGKKITAIYGFCDIRQFTDTTECLQEEVMVYVNKLGDIMHSGTHHYYGMANKNVGDAFLLSWKICDGELPRFSRFTDLPTEEDRVLVNQTVRCPLNPGAGVVPRRITPTEMADSALTAFMKCLIDLDNANTNGSLTEYLSRKSVVKRFGPDFRIKMGFGMHVGWAVEGAIGSRCKIDATYISPHVEMADRLEAGSKIYMTPLNLSHWFVALLSPAARRFTRKMDRISIRGVDTPLTVYTLDVTVMKKGFGTPKIDPTSGMQQPVDFENDPEYMEIRERLEPAFLESGSSAVEAYIAGDWAKARHYLTHALQIRPQDGPCKHLMQVLKEYDFEAPPDWKGYRYVAGY